MQVTQSERVHFLNSINSALREFILPELHSQNVKDVGRLLADMVDQLTFEAEL